MFVFYNVRSCRWQIKIRNIIATKTLRSSCFRHEYLIPYKIEIRLYDRNNIFNQYNGRHIYVSRRTDDGSDVGFVGGMMVVEICPRTAKCATTTRPKSAKKRKKKEKKCLRGPVSRAWTIGVFRSVVFVGRYGLWAIFSTKKRLLTWVRSETKIACYKKFEIRSTALLFVFTIRQRVVRSTTDVLQKATQCLRMRRATVSGQDSSAKPNVPETI